MTRTKLHYCLTESRTSPALLVFASAFLAAACSPEYPLGDLSQGALPIDGGSKVAAARVPDHTISPVLGAPDVSMTLDATVGGITNVGDLDGDGLPEIAMFEYDAASDLSYVHLRYGVPRLSNVVDQVAWRESGAILVLDGPAMGLQLGAAMEGQVSAAGDVDGDGYADLLVSTGECFTTPDQEGVYLVYGAAERLAGTQRLADVAVRFVPPQWGVTPGVIPNTDGPEVCNADPSVVAGDLDGDGLSDLVFAEGKIDESSYLPIDEPGAQGIYVFYGSSQRFESGTPWARADAHLSTSGYFSMDPFRDANGDGTMDLLVGYSPADPGESPTFWLPGSTQRLSGTLPLASVATELSGAFLKLGDFDLDGDGLSDVLLADSSGRGYLFYGAPGLFHDGVDLTAADALLGNTFGSPYLLPVGDLDGDGDTELLGFPNPYTGFAPAFAFLSGQRQRRSGDVAFPPDETQSDPAAVPHFDDPHRIEDGVFPAGDLDGDGADDLFGVSTDYVLGEDGSLSALTNPELHIYYGTPASAAPGNDVH